VDCWPSEALLGHMRSADAGKGGAPSAVKSSLDAR
jgi:hypothetical protein